MFSQMFLSYSMTIASPRMPSSNVFGNECFALVDRSLFSEFSSPSPLLKPKFNFFKPSNATGREESFSNKSERRDPNGSFKLENASSISSTNSSNKEKNNDKQKKSFKVSLNDVLAFDGPAPESINGRLAMLGFAWGVWTETNSNLRISDQLFLPEGEGLFWFLFTSHVISWASIIPLCKGILDSNKSNDGMGGVFKIETAIGRAAMTGFVILLLLENVMDAPLF